MKKDIKALHIFFKFWSEYAQMDRYHKQWARDNLHPIQVNRGELLYNYSSPQRNLYFVCQGMIAFVSIDPSIKKRKIESVALAYNSLKSTNHLYSGTPRTGSIVALRSSLVLRIAYERVKKLKNRDPVIDILFDVLTSREIRQHRSHISILLLKSPLDRYRLFREQLFSIQSVMTQQEQADYLGISKRTLQECQYLFLKSLNS